MSGRLLFICDGLTTAAAYLRVSKLYKKESFFLCLDGSSFSYLREHNVEATYLLTFSNHEEGEHEVAVTRPISPTEHPKMNSLRRVLKFIMDYSAFTIRVYRVRRVLHSFTNFSVFIPSDRSHGNGYLMPCIHYLKKSSCKLFIIETSKFALEEQLVKTRIGNPTFEVTAIDRFLFSKFVHSNGGEMVMHYGMNILLTWQLFNVLPKNPEAMGSSGACVVLVRSKEAKKRLMFNGVDSARIRVIGPPYNMDCREKLAGNFEARAGCHVGIALSQIWEHGLATYSQSIQLITAQLVALNSLGVSPTVYFHPKMRPEDYAAVLSKFSCKVFSGNTEDDLGSLSLLLNTFSSLTEVAILSGVPSHIYDPIGLGYKAWDNYTSVSYSESLEELTEFLEQFINNSRFRNDIYTRCETDRYLLGWDQNDRELFLNGKYGELNESNS